LSAGGHGPDIEERTWRGVAQARGVDRLEQVNGDASVVRQDLRDEVADGVAFFARNRAEAVVGGGRFGTSAARVHERIG
jgi:hypothetical protein